LAQVTYGKPVTGGVRRRYRHRDLRPQQRKAFEEFGELLEELLKLAALLVFGALNSPAFLGEIPWAAESSRSSHWS
jgi:hypothetical protein